MHLANYLGYLRRAEANLADGFRTIGEGHIEEVDIYHMSQTLAAQCEGHVERLASFVERYGEERPTEPDRLHHELFIERRAGGLGLLRDLHDLYVMANACDIAWTMIGQAAKGVGDAELNDTVSYCEPETGTQIRWLKTRMKQAAPQALIAAD